MPCNLAVSITKASVTEEKLLKLLTPQAVQPVVESYLRQPGVLKAGEEMSVTVSGERVIATVGSLTFTIQGGRVTVRAQRGYNDRRGRELTDALSTLLAGAADVLFAQQVKAALGPLGRQAKQQQVTVENGSATQVATLLTLKL